MTLSLHWLWQQPRPHTRAVAVSNPSSGPKLDRQNTGRRYVRLKCSNFICSIMLQYIAGPQTKTRYRGVYPAFACQVGTCSDKAGDRRIATPKVLVQPVQDRIDETMMVSAMEECSVQRRACGGEQIVHRKRALSTKPLLGRRSSSIVRHADHVSSPAHVIRIVKFTSKRRENTFVVEPCATCPTSSHTINPSYNSSSYSKYPPAWSRFGDVR
jgi:hypothetical protein